MRVEDAHAIWWWRRFEVASELAGVFILRSALSSSFVLHATTAFPARLLDLFFPFSVAASSTILFSEGEFQTLIFSSVFLLESPALASSSAEKLRFQPHIWLSSSFPVDYETKICFSFLLGYRHHSRFRKRKSRKRRSVGCSFGLLELKYPTWCCSSADLAELLRTSCDSATWTVQKHRYCQKHSCRCRRASRF